MGTAGAFRRALSALRAVGAVVGAPVWRALELRRPRLALASANLSLGVVPLFAWAVASLSAQSFSPFLYFQF